MKAVKVVAGVTLLSTVLLAGGQAFAADTPVNANRDSKVQVKFIEDNTGTNPVNPEDPDPEKPVDPVDPTDPTNPVDPGTNGPLSLDYASILDFGEQKISVKDETYFAKAQIVKDAEGKESTVPNYAQITDKRGGEKGWSLSVKQNGQFKSVTGAKELTGAEITFKNGEAVSSSTSNGPSTVKTEFSLSPDGTGVAQNVMAAKKGEGFGTWVYRSGDATTKEKSIELSVPGSTAKEADTYKTTLTWTLTDTPANN